MSKTTLMLKPSDLLLASKLRNYWTLPSDLLNWFAAGTEAALCFWHSRHNIWDNAENLWSRSRVWCLWERQKNYVIPSPVGAECWVLRTAVSGQCRIKEKAWEPSWPPYNWKCWWELSPLASLLHPLTRQSKQQMACTYQSIWRSMLLF